MLATKPQSFITPIRYPEFPTGVDASALVTQLDSRDGEAPKAWQLLVDRTLTAWLRNPSQLDDENIEPPSGTILRLSMDLADIFREKGFPAPNSIVPDPNGGIVFEWRKGSESEVYHVWDDGTIESMSFAGNRLVERKPA